MSNNVRPEARLRLAADGVVTLRGVLDASWSSHLERALDEALAHPTPLGRQLAHRGFHSDLYLSMNYPAFRAFAETSGVADAVAHATGLDRVVMFTDELLVKEPGTPTETPWHHDCSYWPIAGEAMYSCWIPLDPVDEDTGALEFARGSHLWGATYHPKDFDTGAERVTAEGELPLPDVDALVAPSDRILAACGPGDCVLFHARTLHRSAGNSSVTRRRRAVVLRLVGPDVRYDPRPRTLPLIWGPRLAPGQPLGDDPMFPTLWPRAA